MKLVSISAILFTCGILAAAVLPGNVVPPDPVLVGRSGDISHFIVYLAYGFLLMGSSRKKYVFITALAVSLAAETLQFLTPGRTADALDVLVNMLGTGAAFLLFACWKRAKKIK